MNATFAFSTVRLKQRLPKHPHMAVAKDPSRRVDVGSLLSHQNYAPLLEQSINLSQHHSE